MSKTNLQLKLNSLHQNTVGKRNNLTGNGDLETQTRVCELITTYKAIQKSSGAGAESGRAKYNYQQHTALDILIELEACKGEKLIVREKKWIRK